MYSFVDRRASKAPPRTVLLVLPPECLSTQSRRLRLLVSHAISSSRAAPRGPTNRSYWGLTSSPRWGGRRRWNRPSDLWPAKACNRGRSSKTCISSAASTASAPAHSSPTQAWSKSSTSATWRPRPGSPYCSARW